MNEKQENVTCNNHICHHRMAFMLDNFVRKLIQHPGRIVREYIKPGDTVIDLGCGPGFFSMEMAKLVGEAGQVIAADLQEEMLARVRQKADKKKLMRRLRFHKCQPDRVGLKLEDKADFMLAFYMIHETPDPMAFLNEVKSLLKKGGKFLVVEPKMHVNQEKYEQMIAMAQQSGYHVLGFPKKKGGRSVLLSI